MNRGLKWLMILGISLIVIVLAVFFIVPKVVDARRYRPQIEKMVSRATGRPFELGGDLRLSIFPWTSIAVSDVHLGNPPGFDEKDMISVASFEVQVKFLPFVLSLFKDIQVKRFVLKEAKIVLERDKDGRTNWEGIGQTSSEVFHEAKKKRAKPSEAEPGERFPVKAISADEFVIADGSVSWIDHTKGQRVQVSDISLKLWDVSLVHPVHLVFSALVDGHRLSLNGNVGPLGTSPGKGKIPLDISFNALEQLDVKLKGDITDASSSPRVALSVDVAPFSPRKLAAATGLDFPVVTADPDVLTRVTLNANIKGDSNNISVSDGRLGIDESQVQFFFKAEEFSRPDITFDMDLDQIDLDRYLPPQTGKDTESETVKVGSPGPVKKKIDYAPFRRLVLNGTVRIKKLKAAKVRMQDVNLRITGKDGLFRLEPFDLKLYEGALSACGSLNVEQDAPVCDLRLKAKEIHARPFLSDMLEKDFLSGKLNGDMNFRFIGDNFEKIKKSLKGKGSLLIADGAIKGIDLGAMVRNTDGAYGFAGKGKAQRRTEFSKFQSPFNMKNGIIYTDNTAMLSSLFRFHTRGKVDLLKQTLNLRLEPTFITTRKKDSEKMKRSEVMVPVLVTGSLSSPKFRPDLKGIGEQKLEEKVFKSKRFKKIFEKEELKPLEKDVRDLLKGFLDVPAGPEEGIPDEKHQAN